MFARQGCFKRGTFGVKLSLDGELGHYDWSFLKTKHQGKHHLFLTYKVQTAEVAGELSDIIDLFVRINSTGKPLTSGEKRRTLLPEPISEGGQSARTAVPKVLTQSPHPVRVADRANEGNRVDG